MAKKDITDGERLCTFIKREILDSSLWPRVVAGLSATARGEGLAQSFEEVAAVHLTGRLVSGGGSISEQMGPAENIASAEFEREFRTWIRETTELSVARRREIEPRLLKLATGAVRAARGTVSRTTDRSLMWFAEKRHPRCYLCGRVLLFVRGEDEESFSPEEKDCIYEAEHVWPQSFGGNSEEENLLPACRACNRHKANYANWAAVDIHALIFGLQPTPEQLQHIRGSHRFALLSFAAYELAEREGKSLKEAFLQVGHGVEPYVLNTRDVADFFNLRNTGPSEE